MIGESAVSSHPASLPRRIGQLRLRRCFRRASSHSNPRPQLPSFAALLLLATAQSHLPFSKVIDLLLPLNPASFHQQNTSSVFSITDKRHHQILSQIALIRNAVSEA